MRKILPALAACLLSAAPALAQGPAYHVMRMPGAVRTPAAGTMLYYGGPVISAVRIQVVFWGAGVAPATVTGVEPFLAAMANSTFTDQLGQYSTKGIVGVNGKPGTNQIIKRGTSLPAIKITPKNTATRLTDAAVQSELLHQITIGKLPQKTPNTLYMVYFPAKDVITLGGLTSCQQFGAYHEATPGKVGTSNLFYGIMPDCGGGFPEITVVSSHEFAEAISDAIPTPGSHPAFPQAWNTSGGSEIGDLCEGSNATLTAGATTYTVQEEFDAKTNACATGNYTSP